MLAGLAARAPSRPDAVKLLLPVLHVQQMAHVRGARTPSAARQLDRMLPAPSFDSLQWGHSRSRGDVSALRCVSVSSQRTARQRL